MAVITVNLTDKFEDWRVKTNEIAAGVGDLGALTNTVVEEIGIIEGDIGLLSNLQTTDQSNLVSAINEVKRGSLALAIALG